MMMMSRPWAVLYSFVVSYSPVVVVAVEAVGVEIGIEIVSLTLGRLMRSIRLLVSPPLLVLGSCWFSCSSRLSGSTPWFCSWGRSWVCFVGGFVFACLTTFSLSLLLTWPLVAQFQFHSSYLLVVVVELSMSLLFNNHCKKILIIVTYYFKMLFFCLVKSKWS